MAEDRTDYADLLNQSPEGWVQAHGIRFLTATAEEVRAELDLGPQHLQAYGIVHGGVHSGLIETLASVGAALFSLRRNQAVVGLENHTTFLKAVRMPGRLTALAQPITRGRRTQVWEGSVRDDEDRLLATGRVRLLCLDPGSYLAGDSIQPAPLK